MQRERPVRLLLMFCVVALAVLGSDCVPQGSDPGTGPSGSGGGAGGSAGATATGGAGGGVGGVGGGGGAGGAAGTGGSTGSGGSIEDAPVATPDAGGTADGGGPPSAAGCTGARLCDDFEAYAVGMPPGGIWKPEIQNGTLVVDEMRARSGKRALHLKGGKISSTTLYVSTAMPALPVASNAFYGRAMVYLPTVPTGDGLHWDMIRGSGKLPDGKSAQYNIATARGNFLTDSEPNDCTRYSKTPFPAGRWACLSWHFDGSPAATGAGTKNEIHLWLDGKPVDDAAVVRFGDQCTYGGRPEWLAPKFDTFKIGWQQYHPGPEFEMWIDDVALDDKMIPCPPP